MRHAKPLRGFTALTALAVLTCAAPVALAVPSFARQTGMACEACHTVFPELTHFGRVFKANGYTLTNLKRCRTSAGRRNSCSSFRPRPPLSIMAQISYTQMQKSVPDLSNVGAPGVAQNGTAGFPQQFSLFYGGQDRAAFRRPDPVHLRQRRRQIRHRQHRPALCRREAAARQRHAHLRAVAQQQSDGAGSVELDPGMGFPVYVAAMPMSRRSRGPRSTAASRRTSRD